MSWQTLGAVAPGELVEARLQLHHAAQLVASAGITFLPPQPDDSHPNLGWSASLHALLGRELPGAKVHVGLRVADLSLLVVDTSGAVTEELALEGQSLDEAYTWLAETAARAGLATPAAGLAPSPYAIPDHPTGGGAPFSSAPGDAFAELSGWFANGQEAIAQVAADTPGASEIRCWPHHLDLATLVTVKSNADGSLAKSIGLGLSPGDEGYSEPYWYVSPWPYPDASSLPALASGGHWHTDGHTSAILTGTQLLEGPAERQGARLHAFIEAAVDASRRALGV